MKAVYVKEPKSLDIAEIPIPQAGRGEVLVRVRAAGICGSDMHIYHGTNPLAEYPRVIGHEFAGEIAALGEDLPPEKRGLSVGDHVTVDPVTSCGVCYPCSVGRRNVCSRLKVFGVHQDGGMAEYVSVPAANAYAVPPEWSWEKAAMTEPFSIAANVLSRTGCVPSDRVLIMGAGPIGLTVLMGAVLTGARVAVADVLDSRLETARELGAELIVNSGRQNLEDEMFEWTKEGVPLIVDAVCIPALFPSLLKMASPAGRIAHLGFSERPAEVIPLEITKKELSIVGSRLNCNMFPRVIEWFEKGLDPEKLISHTFPFTQVREAFSFIEEKPLETCKVMLTF
jgi:L-gulonate 5-dehydrogenase